MSAESLRLAIAAPEAVGITDSEWQRMGAAWHRGHPSEAQLLLLATFAYLSVEAGNAPLGGWPWFGLDSPTYTPYHSDPYQGFSLQQGSDLVLSFRGTQLPHLKFSPLAGFSSLGDSIQQWLTNFTIDLTDFPAENPVGRAHLGFAAAVLSLWSNIRRDVKAFIRAHPSGSRIYVTGHSQGAALALLATLLLIQMREKHQWTTPIHTAVFAPPLVGNQALTDVINAAITSGSVSVVRYTNQKDPVPLLPPVKDYAPGPGTHIHFRPARVTIPMGKVDDYFTGRSVLSAGLSGPLGFANHYPAGPEIPLVSRPGYLPFLSFDAPPPF